MIAINNLQFSFNSSFDLFITKLLINKGDITGIVGNNGSGKTTLQMLILDLLEPEKGEISIKNEPVSKEAWKKFTGSYLNESFLFGFYKPLEYLKFISQFYNIDKPTLLKAYQQYDFFIQSDEIIGSNKLIKDLSTGNKSKLGILSTIIIEPDLIILDEPFAHIDPTSKSNLKKIFSQLKNEKETTILFSSNDLNHTIDVCDKVILLEDGRIIQENDKSDSHINLTNYFRTDY